MFNIKIMLSQWFKIVLFCVRNDSFKVLVAMVDFNIKKCERFIDMVSDFILQLTFKKILLTEFFLLVVVLRKNIYIIS